MKNDWKQLTDMTSGQEICVREVELKETGISVKGEFELPPMAKLPMDDQVFVAAFVKCHGSIKEMEKLFGVSYPTIKSRLNKIASGLDILNIQVEDVPIPQTTVLDDLSSGTISVDQALEQLRSNK